MPRFPLVCIAAILVSCVTGALQAQFQDQHYRTWREEIPGTSPASNIMVRNISDDTIVVTRIQLSECKNLQEGCSLYKPNIIVAPGRTVQAMRINSMARNMGFSFGYRMWIELRGANAATGSDAVKQAMKNDQATATAETPHAIVGTAPRVRAVLLPISNPAEFIPLVAPEKDKGDCEPVTGGISQPGDRTLALAWTGDRYPRRTLLVEFDSLWRIYRYEDNRNQPRTDKIVGPPLVRTTILIAARTGTATLWNVNNTEAESFQLVAPDMINAASLGVPSDMAAQVMKRCGKHTPPATIELAPATASPPPTSLQVPRPSGSQGGAPTPSLSSTGPVYRPPPADGRVGLTTTGQTGTVVLKTITDPTLFVPRVGVPTFSGTCTREPALDTSAHLRRFGMAWTGNGSLLRRVVVDIDTLGKTVSYIDTRYGTLPDGAAPGTMPPATIIKIANGSQQASLMNVGGTEPAEGFAFFTANVYTNAGIGTPQSTIDMVLATCRSN